MLLSNVRNENRGLMPVNYRKRNIVGFNNWPVPLFELILICFLVGTHVGILAFANSANIKHSFTNVQDIGTIKKALDQIFLSGSANIVIAFNEAKRQINEVHGGEEHKRRRVLIVASNGKYPCKKNNTFS